MKGSLPTSQKYQEVKLPVADRFHPFLKIVSDSEKLDIWIGDLAAEPLYARLGTDDAQGEAIRVQVLDEPSHGAGGRFLRGLA